MDDLYRLQRRYLENLIVFRGLSKHTCRGYKHSINAYLKFARDPKATSLTKAALEDWIRYGKLERNWSPKTIKNHMKAWVSKKNLCFATISEDLFIAIVVLALLKFLVRLTG